MDNFFQLCGSAFLQENSLRSWKREMPRFPKPAGVMMLSFLRHPTINNTEPFRKKTNSSKLNNYSIFNIITLSIQIYLIFLWCFYKFLLFFIFSLDNVERQCILNTIRQREVTFGGRFFFLPYLFISTLPSCKIRFTPGYAYPIG